MAHLIQPNYYIWKNVLEGLTLKPIGLKDVDLKFDEIDESGNEPLGKC